MSRRGAVTFVALLTVGVLLLVALAEVADRSIVPRLLGDPSPTPSPTAAEGRRDLFVLPDDGAEIVLDEFRRAERTIDIAVYLLTSNEVVEVLGDAAGRGLRVRVLLEPDPYGGGGDVEADAAQLRALGIDVRFSGKDVRFGHIKTFVVDERVALVTSLNLTNAGLTDNRELGVISTELIDVLTATRVFESDWEGNAVDPLPGSLVLSPVNSRDVVEGLISTANFRLDVYAEVVRDAVVIDLLVKRATEGMPVRLIVPDEISPDDADVYARLTAAGVEVRTLTRPYQHAKMILTDGEEVLVGSINLTSTSMDDNREAGMILDDPASLARLTTVFEADWANAEPVTGQEEATAVYAGWLG